jgi:hypothetical protein
MFKVPPTTDSALQSLIFFISTNFVIFFNKKTLGKFLEKYLFFFFFLYVNLTNFANFFGKIYQFLDFMSLQSTGFFLKKFN